MKGSVVVIGGANRDTVARSDRTLQPATSNPGHTVSTPGGVARNIAENLARLGTPVTLVCAVGDDDAGRAIIAQTAAVGVDISHILCGTQATGSYTAIVDPNGELVVAVADMQVMEQLTADQLPSEVIAGAGMIVADGNLPPAVLARVLELADAPLLIDPVSAPKAARLAPLLNPSRPIHTITPDWLELAALSGQPVTSAEQAVAAARTLLERGVERVWVRQGAGGSMLVRAQGVDSIPAIPATPVNVTGAGDAMLAAYVHALTKGRDDIDAARDGAAAAYLTMTCDDTVRPDLDEFAVARVRRQAPGAQR